MSSGRGYSVDTTHTDHENVTTSGTRYAIAANENTGEHWGRGSDRAGAGEGEQGGAQEGRRRGRRRGAQKGGWTHGIGPAPPVFMSLLPEQVRPRNPALPDLPGMKVWVGVRVHVSDTWRIVHRRRTGGFEDTGGIYATILTPESLRQARDHAQYRGTTRRITVEGVHHTGEWQSRPHQDVILSRALGPFHDLICSAIFQDERFIGPAYPGRRYPQMDTISDTQVCVSGGIKPGENGLEAAFHEVLEELGFEARIESAMVHPRIVRGVANYLFWAYPYAR